MKPLYLLPLIPYLLYGCAVVTDARLYDFNSGMLSHARFYDLEDRHGRITATMYDGEVLRGEFTLTDEHSSALPSTVRIDFDQPPVGGNQNGADASTPQPHTDKTLSGVFGFTPDGDAKPAGIATLVGDKGTVLQVVIYDLDTIRGIGSGVGLDNKGNWYLVRLGA